MKTLNTYRINATSVNSYPERTVKASTEEEAKDRYLFLLQSNELEAEEGIIESQVILESTYQETNFHPLISELEKIGCVCRKREPVVLYSKLHYKGLHIVVSVKATEHGSSLEYFSCKIWHEDGGDFEAKYFDRKTIEEVVDVVEYEIDNYTKRG